MVCGLEIENTTILSFEDTVVHITNIDLMREFRREVLPFTLFLGAMSIAGFLGNLFVLYVHMFRYKRCNFRYFVLGLSIIDSVSCIVTIPFEMFTQLHYYNMNSEYICKVKTFLSVASSVAMVYILLMLTLDRYRKVLAPHGWQITRKHVVFGYIGTLILSIVQSLPSLAVWGMNKRCVTYKGQTLNVKMCGKDESFKDTLWPNMYIMCLTPNYIGITVIIIMYGIIFRRLSQMVHQGHEVKRFKDKNNTNQKKESYNSVLSNTKYRSRTSELQPIFARRDIVELNDTKQSRSYKKSVLNVDTIAKTNERDICEAEEGNSFINSDLNSNEANANTSEVDVNTNDMSIITTEGWHDNIKRDINTNDKDTDDNSDIHVSRCDNSSNISKMKRLTMLTFVFSITFICTAICYMVFSSQIADIGEVVDINNIPLEVAFLFGYRIYFINYMMHPILYGCLDPSFKRAVSHITGDITNCLRKGST